MSPRFALILVVTAAAASSPLDSLAQPAKDGAGDRGSFSLLLENDAFASTDRHYTSGLQASWLTGPRGDGSVAAALLGWLPGNERGAARLGFQLGQTVYTPADKESRKFLPQQRPYAAWLYGGLAVVYATERHVDTVSLEFGTIGPDARGEALQNSVHEWLDASRANGWAHQLGNQRGGMLIVERKWRALVHTDVRRFGVDLLPHVGMSLGNIEQYANAGFSVRVGNDLDNDFGPPRIRPSLPGSDYFVPPDVWSWYLFAGADGRYVDKNIFIDDHAGNAAWRIDKNDWVTEVQGGIVVTRGNFRLACTYVRRSEEFAQQLEPDRFGSLALTWRF